MSFYGGRDKEYDIDAQKMLSIITGHLSMPGYILKLAGQFLEESSKVNNSSLANAKSPKSQQNIHHSQNIDIINIPINLSIHWRFNPKEFNLDNINSKIGDVLENLHPDTPKYMFGKPDALANSILRHVENSANDMEEKFIEEMVLRYGSVEQRNETKNPKNSKNTKILINPLTIYITAPSDSLNYINRIKTALNRFTKKFNKISSLNTTIATSSDLIAWSTKFQNISEFESSDQSDPSNPSQPSNCSWIQDNFYDISSMLEQQLCEASDIFIHNQPVSTWSGVVLGQRKSEVSYAKSKLASYKQQKEYFSFSRYDAFMLDILSQYLYS